MRAKTTSRWWRWSSAIAERYLRRQVSAWPAAMSLAHPLRPAAGAWHRTVNVVWAPVLRANLRLAFRHYDAARIGRIEIRHVRTPRALLPAALRPRFESVVRSATFTFETRTRISRMDTRLESAATLVRRTRQHLTSETKRFEKRSHRVQEVERSLLRRFQRVEIDALRAATVLRNSAPAPAAAATLEATVEKRPQSPGFAGDFSGPGSAPAAAELNVDRLAERVMDRIDRRMVAWRERIGRI